MSGEKIQLDPAYQKLSLIDESNRAILYTEKGKKELKGITERDKGEDIA